ncbi:hypothetical protein ACWCQL_15210 [Streptomyces sp. NPDC002073]
MTDTGERYGEGRHGAGRPGAGGDAPGRDGSGPPGPELSRLEANLRDLLAEDAAEVRPAPAPYPAIVRQGRQERQRRLAATGAALMVLTVVPAAAYAFAAGGSSDSAAKGGVAAAPRQSAPAKPSPAPTGPAGPATPGQLADGITMAQAAKGLEGCLGFGRTHDPRAGAGGGKPAPDLGKAGEYRILLAHRSAGNANSPGDGRYIVAVKDKPQQTRLICHLKEGKPSGINISTGSDATPDSGPVVPDMNGGKLFLQSFTPGEPWVFPFRWGSIGTVDPKVAKVTVSYGGATVDAAIDHGWFAATGILERAVTKTPHIVGYDAQGKQVYDSDRDRQYQKEVS